MFKLLQQPFPAFIPCLRGVVLCFTGGFCVFLVLFVFKAFGMHNFETGQRAVYAGIYAGITILIALVNTVLLPWIIPSVFREEQWTVGKEILTFIWLLICISAGNLIASNILDGEGISLINFVRTIGITASVGIIPISISILVKQQSLLKRYATAARQIEEKVFNPETSFPKTSSSPVVENFIELTGDNAGDKLAISLKDLLYINAADNYIKIYYTDPSGTKQFILRSTLKKTEESLAPFPQFFRCHRTYIVNLDKVRHISGNAQGYKLHLAETNDLIPVSRSYNSTIAQKLNDVKKT